jgi:hypothetical protein
MATEPSVLVVNVIPRLRSGEKHQDSEPSLAVNPRNPLQIAASAFTPDPNESDQAPHFRVDRRRPYLDVEHHRAK